VGAFPCEKSFQKNQKSRLDFFSQKTLATLGVARVERDFHNKTAETANADKENNPSLGYPEGFD
jgi:hypothetical protein|tara:strand:+ start:769 stop:960 length:192 start_codon:yes stop_codon:yes gene_type:complete